MVSAFGVMWSSAQAMRALQAWRTEVRWRPLSMMRWASLYIVEAPAVTARLEVDYRKPVMLNRSYELDGWVEGRDGRKLFLRIEARDTGGDLVAEGKGLFLQVPMEHFLKEMPDDVPDEVNERMQQAGSAPPW